MAMWQFASPGAEKRLTELAELFSISRALFFELQDDYHWMPGTDSLAEHDLRNTEVGPNRAWGEDPVRRKFDVVGNYLLTVSGHLGGLATLHAGQEVLFSPPLLVRAIIENCARAVWVLAVDDPNGTRTRVSRAYLEELFSAEDAKAVAGRLSDKSGETYEAAASAYRNLRDEELPALFNGVSRETLGKKELEGQSLPRPEGCALWMYEEVSRIGTGISGRQAQGVYGFLCNMTHPTLYPVRQMTDWHQVEGSDHLESHLSLDLPFLEKLAGAAIVTHFNTASLFMSYMGWKSARHSAWEDVIERTLPGTFT
jgi:hypothetical protein